MRKGVEHLPPQDQSGVKAYALLRSEPLQTLDVVNDLNQIQGVNADACISPNGWNIAAVIQTRTTQELGEVYHEKILQTPGILQHGELLPVIG